METGPQPVKKIPHILWNMEVYYRIHNRLSSGPVLGQNHPNSTPILPLEDKLEYYPPTYI
jgi:hypothetical protein